MENDDMMQGFTALQEFIELSLASLQKSIKAEFDDVKYTLQVHERRFDRIDQRFERIEGDLATIKTDVNELKRDVRQLGRGRREP